MGVSKLLEKHIAALKAVEGKTVEAGWFESNRYSDGTSVAYIAKILNDGALIKVPEREQKIYRSINEATGLFNNGGRFVKASKSNYMTTHTVAAYNIIIPARPFMDKAQKDFEKSLPELQKKLGKRFLEGKLSADGMLNQIGLHLEGLIVDSMNNGGWAPNAKSTIARKGFDKPLKHWGTMIQTVTYKIVS
jgi:hypothetical protein